MWTACSLKLNDYLLISEIHVICIIKNSSVVQACSIDMNVYQFSKIFFFSNLCFQHLGIYTLILHFNKFYQVAVDRCYCNIKQS